MTQHDRTAVPDDIQHQLETHSEIPPITATDDVLYHDRYVFIIHSPGNVTRVGITRRENGARISSIVCITDSMPDRITPADDVIQIGRITHIDHGPGRSTRVIQ